MPTDARYECEAATPPGVKKARRRASVNKKRHRWTSLLDWAGRDDSRVYLAPHEVGHILKNLGIALNRRERRELWECLAEPAPGKKERMVALDRLEKELESSSKHAANSDRCGLRERIVSLLQSGKHTAEIFESLFGVDAVAVEVDDFASLALSSGEKYPETVASRLCREIDRQRRGVITYEDFARWALQFASSQPERKRAMVGQQDNRDEDRRRKKYNVGGCDHEIKRERTWRRRASADRRAAIQGVTLFIVRQAFRRERRRVRRRPFSLLLESMPAAVPIDHVQRKLERRGALFSEEVFGIFISIFDAAGEGYISSRSWLQLILDRVENLHGGNNNRQRALRLTLGERQGEWDDDEASEISTSSSCSTCSSGSSYFLDTSDSCALISRPSSASLPDPPKIVLEEEVNNHKAEARLAAKWHFESVTDLEKESPVTTPQPGNRECKKVEVLERRTVDGEPVLVDAHNFAYDLRHQQLLGKLVQRRIVEDGDENSESDTDDELWTLIPPSLVQQDDCFEKSKGYDDDDDDDDDDDNEEGGGEEVKWDVNKDVLSSFGQKSFTRVNTERRSKGMVPAKDRDNVRLNVNSVTDHRAKLSAAAIGDSYSHDDDSDDDDKCSSSSSSSSSSQVSSSSSIASSASLQSQRKTKGRRRRKGSVSSASASESASDPDLGSQSQSQSRPPPPLPLGEKGRKLTRAPRKKNPVLQNENDSADSEDEEPEGEAQNPGACVRAEAVFVAPAWPRARSAARQARLCARREVVVRAGPWARAEDHGDAGGAWVPGLRAAARTRGTALRVGAARALEAREVLRGETLAALPSARVLLIERRPRWRGGGFKTLGADSIPLEGLLRDAEAGVKHESVHVLRLLEASPETEFLVVLRTRALRKKRVST